jgi:carbonic anhydrase
MSAIEELLRNNQAYAAAFEKNGLTLPPVRRVAILTCMDARLDPARMLGLQEGDAHVIRNAGGVVTDDAIRSLAISQRLLGTEDVVLIHHTDCGMLTFTDESFREQVRKDTGIKPPWAPESFRDVEGDLRQSIARVETSPFLLHPDRVRGFVYETSSGRLREVA